MPLSTRTAALIRGLIYGIQFERDPRNGLDRVIEMVVARGGSAESPADHLGAIREALASDADLSGLLPQPHSDAVLRQFLDALAARIEQRWGATPGGSGGS